MKDPMQKRALVLAAVGSIAALLLLIGVFVFAQENAKKKKVLDVAVSETYAVPSVATSNYGLSLGDDDAPVTLSLYEDLFCGACAEFNDMHGDSIVQWIEEGDINLDLHLLTFQDTYSTDKAYSTRASHAVITVAHEGDDMLTLNFVDALYQSGGDLSDGEIAQLALDVGVSTSVVKKFEDETYMQWLDAAQYAASNDGIHATPTVLIDGEHEVVNWYEDGVLEQNLFQGPLDTR